MINQRFSKIIVYVIILLIVVAMTLGSVASFFVPATPVNQSPNSQQNTQEIP